MAQFRSRAVASLVELHSVELRSFLETWKRFRASGKPMPEARGDADYESPERLVSHVQAAARSYMLWIWEMLEQPIEGLPRIRDAAVIMPELEKFQADTLAGWEKYGALLADEQLGPKQYVSRWGEPHTIEQMLEHAVVHPMRHRRQLQRILES
ncbi:MAG TPA: hypothetical protein VKF80_01640 [Candidatus Eisenbacteria bacterium]|nr:hypothetical protein [Candidatus Eisenbacteria bacterium]